MGVSITALLASVASELVVTEKLPEFGEWSWVAKFSLTSLIFTALALLENCIVIYFYYHSGSSLVPRFVPFVRRAAKQLVKTWNPAQQSSTESRSAEKSIPADVTEHHDPLQGRNHPLFGLSEHHRSWSSNEDAIQANTATSDNNQVRESFLVAHHPIDDFKNTEEMVNNRRWRQKAQLVDECARVLFPVAYAMYLSIAFSQTAT